MRWDRKRDWEACDSYLTNCRRHINGTPSIIGYIKDAFCTRRRQAVSSGRFPPGLDRHVRRTPGRMRELSRTNHRELAQLPRFALYGCRTAIAARCPPSLPDVLAAPSFDRRKRSHPLHPLAIVRFGRAARASPIQGHPSLVLVSIDLGSPLEFRSAKAVLPFMDYRGRDCQSLVLHCVRLGYYRGLSWRLSLERRVSFPRFFLRGLSLFRDDQTVPLVLRKGVR